MSSRLGLLPLPAHGGGREVKGRSTLTTVTSREGNKHESVQARPGTADERGASRGHRRSGPASPASPGAGARDPLAPRGPPAPGELPARPRRASSSSGRSRHLTLPWATRHPRCPVKAAACERRGDGAELRPRARTELPPTGDDPQPPGARGGRASLRGLRNGSCDGVSAVSVETLPFPAPTERARGDRHSVRSGRQVPRILLAGSRRSGRRGCTTRAPSRRGKDDGAEEPGARRPRGRSRPRLRASSRPSAFARLDSRGAHWTSRLPRPLALRRRPRWLPRVCPDSAFLAWVQGPRAGLFSSGLQMERTCMPGDGGPCTPIDGGLCTPGDGGPCAPIGGGPCTPIDGGRACQEIGGHAPR